MNKFFLTAILLSTKLITASEVYEYDKEDLSSALENLKKYSPDYTFFIDKEKFEISIPQGDSPLQWIENEQWQPIDIINNDGTIMMGTKIQTFQLNSLSVNSSCNELDFSQKLYSKPNEYDFLSKKQFKEKFKINLYGNGYFTKTDYTSVLEDFKTKSTLITKNSMGEIILTPNKILLAFKEWSLKYPYLPALDIGGGAGMNSYELSKAGHKLVFFNDLYLENARLLTKAYNEDVKINVHYNIGRFPYDINMAHNSIGNILISYVFHYLTPGAIEFGVKRLFDWGLPGMRVFLTALTKDSLFFNSLKPMYEEHMKVGLKWPGFVERREAPDALRFESVPSHYHMQDKEVLIREFEKVGFITEYANYFDFFKTDDQKESPAIIGCIFRKPGTLPNIITKINS